MLSLKRPIAFIDIESTGSNCQEDRIIEISICKLFPDYTRETRTRQVNPVVPIKSEATKVHGISNADVADWPVFASLAKGILAYIQDCDIAGFNSNSFDLPMLYLEFLRCGISWEYQQHLFIDVGNLFKIQEPRTLSAGVKFYLGREHSGAHGAQADTEATLDIFLTQMDKYPELPKDLVELSKFTNFGKRILDMGNKFTESETGEILINFGEYRGQPAANHIGLMHWMLGKSFMTDTLRICQSLIDQSQQQSYAR